MAPEAENRDEAGLRPGPFGDCAMSTETASGRAGTFMFDRDAEAMPRRALAALQASRVQGHAGARLRPCALSPEIRRRGRPAGISSRSPTSRFPFTLKSICATITPSACSPCRANAAAAARIVGHHRQAHRRRLHRGRSRHWSDLMARSLAAPACARRHRAYRLRLWPVHRRSWRALRRRAARLHRRAGVGRHTERQIMLMHDFGAGVLAPRRPTR